MKKYHHLNVGLFLRRPLFRIKFFLISIIFLIFYIEIILLIPLIIILLSGFLPLIEPF